jgi:glycosyltransferase involved in cell wall biosynthesis
MPRFSIVIPMFNRGLFIGRAIESCLNQSFNDFEVVVVDDCSTDDSVAVVERFSDTRIRLVRNERNLGVCPTRNRGVASSLGEWIVFLDSDDELLPNALEIMHYKAERVSNDIGRMAFMYRMEDGSLSPQPPLIEDVWDYTAYLRWSDTICYRSDFSNCIRRRTFDLVKLPEDRCFERIYHLEFSRQFMTHTFPNVVAVIHDDAANRSTALSMDLLLNNARIYVQSADRIIAKHGSYMAKYCPRTYRKIIRLTVIYNFLLKHHIRGWQNVFYLLQRQPFWLGGWILLPLGLLDRKTLYRVFKTIASRRIRKAS